MIIDKSLFQSKEWQKLQNDLGKKSFYKETDSYSYLAILETTPILNYLYVPYGPCSASATGFNEAIEALISLAKKENATFIRVEPRTALNAKIMINKAHFAKAYIKKSKDLNPKETWVLDISQEKEQIISGFSQGTRTRFNNYAKKGLSVESTNDTAKISELVRLQEKLFKSKNLNMFSAEYLEKELAQPFSTLYLVKYNKPANVEEDPSLPKEDEIIAASLFFDYEGTRYYMQSAADTDYRKLPATVALLTKAIFDAKEKGLKEFDFWGIAPEGAGPEHPWYGFTEFKKSFGGQAVEYVGTFDIILKRGKYRRYNLIRKLNRIRRKI